ncbi:MAG: GAF domain-containing protein [Anaerolineae bacterium]|nr:GAF domain-containing protein [Anaerolineae bacterium]
MVEQSFASGNTDYLNNGNHSLSPDTEGCVNPLAAINTIVVAASRSRDPDTVLQTALDAVLSVSGADAVAIGILDEFTGEIDLRVEHGWRDRMVTQGDRIALGGSVFEAVVSGDKVIVSDDLVHDTHLNIPPLPDGDVRALALLPMHARGNVVGVVGVLFAAPHTFPGSDIVALCTIADQIGLALDNFSLIACAQAHENRCSTICDLSSEAFVLIDGQGIIRQINTAAHILFDTIPADVIGLSLAEAPIHADLADSLRSAVRNHHGVNTVFETLLVDGRTLSTAVVPVRSDMTASNGTATYGSVIVVRDVSNRQPSRFTGRDFIHDIAHDLRNPLGAALGALAMLAGEQDNQSDLQRELIGIATKSIDRAQQLIEDLSYLEQILNTSQFEYQPVDVRDVVERGVIDIQAAVFQREQTLEIDVPDFLPPVMGNDYWLHQALKNLLSNANRYTASGGHITIRAYEQHDQVLVEVHDDGPGIPLEIQPRLFERFYRGPTAERGISGTGLGLSIVKAVVDRHGGKVFVSSQINKGSVFGMILPLTQGS